MTFLKTIALSVLLIKFLLITNLYAHDEKLMPGGRPDSHAPIGVMGDHMHKEGEYMISYRYMNMEMEGLINGSNSVSEIGALSHKRGDGTTYRIIPDSMKMDMHMLGFMYGIKDNITLMGMTNFIKKEMTNNTYNMMGTSKVGSFVANTSGLGDSSISALLKVTSEKINSHINIGLSLPTGSTKEEITALMPSGTNKVIRAPYGMQLGTGTYDLLIGYSLSQKNDDISWGTQIKYKRSLNDNNGWHFGNKLEVSSWLSYLWNEEFSSAIRFLAIDEDSIDGNDSLITGRNPSQETANYGGRSYYLGFSLNIVGQDEQIRGHRLALEFLTPLKQDLNGLQMEKGNSLILAYQKAW
tara:strand:- start:928 stop:1989 length:1062 start_codon:yes stop_codon:yes gene_type:complete